LKVAKFGGSSVRDAQAMMRVMNVVKNRPDIKVVVISATYNTTNRLEQMAALASMDKGPEAFAQFLALHQFHVDLAKNLQVWEDDIIPYMRELYREGAELIELICQEKEISTARMDRVYSMGERYSTRILAQAFNHFHKERKTAFLDIRPYLKTDSQFGLANPQFEKVEKLIQANLGFDHPEGADLIVTQGFIGSNDHGLTTTLGREGSDFTATILGSALKAEEVQIWTDVAGVATADPRKVSTAKFIPHMSYNEASTMSHLGAKVLFPRTLEPVEKKGIPVYVRSTLEPNKRGTRIDSDGSGHKGVLAICSQITSQGVEISFVGNELGGLNIKAKQVRKGKLSRTFLVDQDISEETLCLWHDQYIK
jgi:aspartate kinase